MREIEDRPIFPLVGERRRGERKRDDRNHDGKQEMANGAFNSPRSVLASGEVHEGRDDREHVQERNRECAARSQKRPKRESEHRA